jgi:phospholipid/cholesterol/gamma-HCH transport system substrate-binding protein
MKRFSVETAVGIFLLAGFFCFAWLAVRLGDVGFFQENSYQLNARFSSVAGLQPGAIVEVAGVRVGEVTGIRLDPEYYEAVVQMAIDSGVKLQEDSIASIRSTGIIGDRYVSISPGGAPETLAPGGEIVQTESSVSIEDLISKYIFQKK